MATNYLRDKNGSTIGKIETASDGKQKIYDKNGSYLGEYDPKSNYTRNKNGSTVGTGNLLSSLLVK